MAKPTKSDTKTSSKFLREVDFRINDKMKATKQDRIVEALTEKNQQLEKMLPFRNRVKELTVEIERLRAEVKGGTEKREVYCIKEYDFTKNLVRTRRVDNREVVDEVTMTAEERLEVLPGVVKDPRDEGKSPKAPPPPAEDDDAEETEPAN